MTKRTGLILTLISAAIQLLLAFSGAIPPLAAALTSIIGADEQARLIAVVGCQFALLSFSLTAQWLAIQHQVERSTAALVDGQSARVEKLRDDDFYQQFLRAARHAKDSVLICYFASGNPDDGAPPERKAYYAQMADLMKRRREVHFRRIVLDSPANRVWLGQMFPKIKGCTNIDIALLADPGADSPKSMPLPLSVQLVDKTDCWLVAITSHERGARTYRDLHIRNGAAAEALTEYFERLWARSEPVVVSGAKTEKGKEYMPESTLGGAPS